MTARRFFSQMSLRLSASFLFNGVAAASIIVLPIESIAQAVKRTVEIRDEVSCATCSISVTTLAQLAVSSGPGSLNGLPMEIQLDSLNRYWVAPAPSGSPIIFDSNGKFVASLGRAGQGPGEYLGASFVRLFGRDSALVFDGGMHRITIVDMNLRVVRSFQSVMRSGDFVQVGNTLVGSGDIRTPGAAGLPLHVFQLPQPATPIHSFAPRRDNWQGATTSTSMNWRVAPGTTQAFWTSDLNEYRIVGWAAPGNDVVEFIRKPEWFAARSPIVGGGNRTPPPPLMRDLIEDSEGLLWVAGLSASVRWKEAWAQSTGGGVPSGPPRSGVGDMPVRTSSTPSRRINLEVIDPRIGRVVTRLTMEDDEYLVGLLPKRRAGLYSEDANGNPRLRIVQLGISGR